MGATQSYVDELVGWTCRTLLRGAEVLTASFSGEDSDFVRFNGGSVRQAGSVRQRQLTIDLIEGRRHCAAASQLSGDAELDRARLATLVEDLRERRRLVPDDPYLLYATDAPSTERFEPAELPEPEAAVADVRAAGTGRDLVGIYAAGVSYSGFASSLGQRNWYEAATFNLDWSFYLRADKAAKNLYAGVRWDDDAFARKVEWSARQLDALRRDPIELRPGDYRTYLAPAAVKELMDMLAWGGFGLKAHRTRQTPLLRMVTDGASFAPEVRISEATGAGVAPNFQEQGFLRPDEVVLIDGGRYADWLVSPRSAQEFGVPTNGASPEEAPASLAMAPGSVPAAEVVQRLGTGLYVGNLWYLNFSDRSACRTTGMTRFATFWVQDGEIVAPVNVLRFDDTAFHLLGDRLVGLTDEAEVLLDPGSYHRRSTDSTTLPGALVEAMAFTL
jgi:predicted Zn-dependent protease